MRRFGWVCFSLAAGLLPATAWLTTAWAEDPDALWKIVHGKCAVDTKPCDVFDASKGYALLKDRDGASQYLLIPSAKVTGIEDPQILAPDAPNYMALAWGFKDKVGEALHKTLPRDDLSLAINAITGRSQNQLHIHIDCLRADVRDTLKAHLAEVGTDWSTLPLRGHPYRAMRVNGEDLTVNPFTLLAKTTADMGHETLVVAPVTFADGPGFVLLADHTGATLGDRANGEELQDHACALAQ